MIILFCPHLTGWADVGYNSVVLITLFCPHLAGWADIGYNFVVGEDGNAYMARGWTGIGAHTRSYNTEGIGKWLLALKGDTKSLLDCKRGNCGVFRRYNVVTS